MAVLVKRLICIFLCALLIILPACGGSSGGGDGGGGDDGGGADDNNLTIIITFSEDMDTSRPAGTTVAELMPGLFQVRKAHAATGLDGCVVFSIASAVLVSAVWLSTKQIRLIWSGVPVGAEYSLILNYAALCAAGFATASGKTLAETTLLFYFAAAAAIVYLNVTV